MVNKREAQNKISHAIGNGKMPPAKHLICSNCGVSREIDPKVIMDYHHLDHSKPMEVIVLCRRCHIRLHRLGTTLSQDQVRKMSNSAKKSWEDGKMSSYFHSQETKQKISEFVKKFWISRKSNLK